MRKSGRLRIDKKLKSCWICGSEGDSREHLIKASDIRQYFPGISEKNPIYIGSDKRKKIKLCGSKSPHLKSKSWLCKLCNNHRTQPYDKSWEALSNYLYTHYSSIIKSKRLDLKKVFPGESKIKSEHLQLYFVKLTGCMLTDAVGYGDMARSFGKSILDAIPRSDVYLDFCINEQMLDPSLSALHAINVLEKIMMLQWEYTLGFFSIKVSYYSNTLPKNREIPLGWSAIEKTKIIKFSH